MAEREQPYDPYVPSGQNAGGNAGQGNQRTQQLQAVRPPFSSHSQWIENTQDAFKSRYY